VLLWFFFFFLSDLHAGAMERDQGKFAAFKALQDIFPQVSEFPNPQV
jgi:hypothetical protein